MRLRCSRIMAVFTLMAALGYSAICFANTITVNSLNDPSDMGFCTLHDAITAANAANNIGVNGCGGGNGNDIINVTVSGTILLANTLPTIAHTLVINGPTGGISISGQNSVRVMQTAATANATLNGLSIINGSNANQPDDGGGIHCDGTLHINNSTISGNVSNSESGGGGLFMGGDCTATIDSSTISNNSDGSFDSDGAGITDFGPLTITNSTISGNQLTGGDSLGAGIAVMSPNANGTTVVNCTFSGNQAGSNFGSAIGLYQASVTITNSTFAGNTGSSALVTFDGPFNLKNNILANNGSNCGGTFNDNGYNISDDSSCGFTAVTSKNMTDPKLDPAGLKNNGGPTQTIALQSISPAIDAIPYAACTDQAIIPNQITTDQRGSPRPDPEDGASGPCDIGAYEYQTSQPRWAFEVLAAKGFVRLQNASIQGGPPEGAGGKSVLASGGTIASDVVASLSNGLAVAMGFGATVNGQCVSGGGAINIDATSSCAGGADHSGTSPLLATLTTTESDLAAFETSIAALSATKTLSKVVLAPNGSQTITDTVTGGLNVIDVPSVALSKGATLTLSGGASDLAILRVAGTLALDNTSSLVLAGGLKTSNIIVAVGTTTKVGQSATLNGGIVSASGTCAFDLSTTVNGIVACAAGVSATNGVTFNYVAPAF